LILASTVYRSVRLFVKKSSFRSLVLLPKPCCSPTHLPSTPDLVFHRFFVLSLAFDNPAITDFFVRSGTTLSPPPTPGLFPSLHSGFLALYILHGLLDECPVRGSLLSVLPFFFFCLPFFRDAPVHLPISIHPLENGAFLLVFRDLVLFPQTNYTLFSWLFPLPPFFFRRLSVSISFIPFHSPFTLIHRWAPSVQVFLRMLPYIFLPASTIVRISCHPLLSRSFDLVSLLELVY